MKRHADQFRGGFTMVELLVALFICLILLSIFIPYGLHLREQSHRTQCADHLKQLYGALQNYARDNGDLLPRTVFDAQKLMTGYAAFSGADSSDPFAEDSAVQANDVTAAYWLLLRIGKGYVVDPKVFTCPSGGQIADRGDFKSRSNFTGRQNLGYSFAMPYSTNHDYRLTRDLPGDFVLAADLNPGASDQTSGNSENHRSAGQNVLYAYGHVVFVSSPTCAINKDNIYTLQPPPPTTAPASTAPATQPLISPFAPNDISDTYLVPTARD